jgi:hypothetical protein
MGDAGPGQGPAKTVGEQRFLGCETIFFEPRLQEDKSTLAMTSARGTLRMAPVPLADARSSSGITLHATSRPGGGRSALSFGFRRGAMDDRAQISPNSDRATDDSKAHWDTFVDAAPRTDAGRC